MAPKPNNAANGDTNHDTARVLFVCMGNICRSPMAEAVLAHFVCALPSSAPHVVVDSAGTDAYHVDEPPDSRTMAVLRRHGLTGYKHAARRVRPADFDDFDYILAVDGLNLSRLQARAGGKGRAAKATAGSRGKTHLTLFGDWAGDDAAAGPAGSGQVGAGEEMADPYYGAHDGFETVFEQCVRFSQGWIRQVLGYDVQWQAGGKVTATKVQEGL